jgi:porin
LIPAAGESTVEEKYARRAARPAAEIRGEVRGELFGEVLGNASGGLKQGYEGRLCRSTPISRSSLGVVSREQFQIHDDELSRSNLQNFLVVSGIEALPSTWLYEAYFEKQWGTSKYR